MKLKVCGMKQSENILQASQLLPDYLGFIFWKPSARFFNGNIPEIPGSIRKVGVFVDASIAEIISKIQQHQLDLIQLHGHEDVAFCRKLKAEPIQIIKVFSIDNDFDFETLEPFESVCDYFLFDTKGKLPGGNGIAFNWNILKQYKSQKPFFLSGGIGLEDIHKIKQLPLPIYGIDVNSKFEISPGLKNISLLQTLQKKIR